MRRRLVSAAPLALLGLLACGDGATTPGEALAVGSVRMPVRRAVLGEGDTLALRPIVFDPAGAELADADLRWTTSDDAVSRVDPDGVVRPVAHGRAVIRAAAGGRADSVFVTVGADGVAIVDLAPAGGSTLAPGSTHRVVARVRYTVMSADLAQLRLVVQDQGGRLLTTGPQPTASAPWGRETVELSADVAIPATGTSRVHVLVALLPQGATSTSMVAEARYDVAAGG